MQYSRQWWKRLHNENKQVLHNEFQLRVWSNGRITSNLTADHRLGYPGKRLTSRALFANKISPVVDFATWNDATNVLPVEDISYVSGSKVT